MEISKMKTIALLHQSATAAAVALCLVVADAAAQSTSPRPLQRATDEHLALLMSRAYDKIDRAAEEARAKQLSLSDGQPVLTAIYAGAAGCACGNRLTDELWQVRKQRLEEWLKLKPDSTTARLSRAAFLVKYAWMARGGGYANTVNPEGWKLFRERMEEGRKALESLDAKTKRDAGWYEMMLDVGLSQGWPRDKYDAIFFEAVEKYPYYTPFYFSRMQFHSPRWYGTAEEAKRVADDAVERTRSRWGEILYTRLNWAMMDYQMFRNGQADWPRMKTGFEQLVKAYPDPWNVNNFGKFACLARDYRTLSALLPKIGDTPIVLAWENDINYFQQCRAVTAKMG
jgi:hypothetical protein